MDDRQELEQLRRLAELEAKARGGVASPPDTMGPLSGISRGILDPVKGASQILAQGGNAIGLVSDERLQNINDALKQSETDYQAGRGSKGFDWWRMAGNMALPLGAGALVKPAATIGGRAIQAAKFGAATGAMEPVSNPEDGFWTKKAGQGAIGGAAGLLAAPAGEALVSYAGKGINGLANWVRGKFNTLSGANSPVNIEVTIRTLLNDNGVDYNKLSKEAQQTLLNEAKQALDAGGTLPKNGIRGPGDISEAIRRSGDFAALDIKPTLGQVTRDPGQFSRELNMRGLGEAGKPIEDRLNQQVNGLYDNLFGISQASNKTPYEAGDAVIGRIQSLDALKKSAVDEAYNKARAGMSMPTVPGQTPNLDPQRFVNEALNDLESNMLGGSIPSGVVNYLNGISTGKIPFTPKIAEEMIGKLNAISRKSDAQTQLAISKIKDALDAEIERVFPQTAKDFQNARATAKSRFDWHDMVPAAKAVVEGTAAPDDFIKQFVLNGNAKDIGNMMLSLTPAEREAVKGQVIRSLSEKAGMDQSGEVGGFAQRSFNRELDRLGPERLAALVGKDAANKLAQIGRVSAYMIKRPPGESVNESKSAAAVGNLALKLMNLPGMSPMVGAPVERLLAQNRVEAALRGGLQTPAQRPPVLAPELIDKFSYYGGLLSGPAAFGAASQ